MYVFVIFNMQNFQLVCFSLIPPKHENCCKCSFTSELTMAIYFWKMYYANNLISNSTFMLPQVFVLIKTS